jgi:hypothetical protein
MTGYEYNDLVLIPGRVTKLLSSSVPRAHPASKSTDYFHPRTGFEAPERE